MFPLRAMILGSAALTLAGCATSPATDFWNLAPIVRNTDASIDGRSETVKRGDTLAVHLETDLKPTYRWELTRLRSVTELAAATIERGGPWHIDGHAVAETLAQALDAQLSHVRPSASAARAAR